ncbi:MAG: GT4 family glycosyltransferase PelF [Candidatus Dormibacteraeota bacterium]|nr:GT4 family glycosyltransferase PelF [Candidatus Dormibacteraeota bacterium]
MAEVAGAPAARPHREGLSGRRVGTAPHVLLVTEGTYPCYEGGVSYWCDLLVHSLPNLNFSILSLVASPNAAPVYELPSNVQDHVMLPLWGVRDALEGRPDTHLPQMWSRKRNTSEQAIRDGLVPSLRVFLACVMADEGQPLRMAAAVQGMYRFFARFDFDQSMRSEAVWAWFLANARAFLPRAAQQSGYGEVDMTLVDVTNAMTIFYHWLIALSAPLPRADVVHATSGGLSVLPAVAAKMETGCAFVLTEHGIYLRERYLAEADSSGSIFLKLFCHRFARRLTELSYVMADLVCPGSDYNRRWEIHNGCPEWKLHTIYNGLDPGPFMTDAYDVAEAENVVPDVELETDTEAETEADEDLGHVVVWVGRITRIKDLMTLLRAAAIVRATRPEVQFRLYGTAPTGDEAYLRECLALRSELELDDTVIFAGYVESSQTAFNEADVVVLSSISEGFPYAVVEAMLCGRPVVGTAVGGVPEALNGCGIVVEPRNPTEMAAAILTLIADPSLRRQLGDNARDKATSEFTLQQCCDAYESNYNRLSVGEDRRDPAARAPASALTGVPRRSARNVLNDGEVSDPVETSRIHRARRSASAKTGVISSAQNDLRRRLVKRVRTPVAESRAEFEPAVAALAVEVAQRVRFPLEDLEIAAVLESMAISDMVAQQRYGAADVFELAETIFARVERRPPATDFPRGRGTRLIRAVAGVATDYVRGPLAMFPILVLLVAIAAYRLVGNWSEDQVLAMALGITASLLVTNGFTQAGARRAAIYLSREMPGAMLVFLRATAIAATLTVTVLTALTLTLATVLNIASQTDRVIFSVSMLLFATLWLVASALALVDAAIWIGAGLIVGLMVVVGTALVLQPVGFYLVAATAAGYTAALVVMLRALRRGLSHVSTKDRFALPATAYVIHEAIPYFLYGILFMILVLIPHGLAWAASVHSGYANVSARISSVETSLTLPLVPVFLAGGVAEHAARAFWAWAQSSQRRTTTADVRRFARRFARFYMHHAAMYLLWLGIASILAVVVFQVFVSNGVLEQWLGERGAQDAIVMFRAALIAYGLLGWGLFNCLYFMCLGRPYFAVRAVLAGILVAVAAGAYPAALGDVTFAAVAFAIGAAAFLLVSLWGVRQLVIRADYHYSVAT